MNKLTAIVTTLIAIMLMSMTASAYVPPELRTGTQMSELEIVKVALAEHDAGRDTNWVKYTLEEASTHHTNSGRTVNNYFQLRGWVQKVESQKQPGHGYVWIQPAPFTPWPSIGWI